MAGGSCPAGGTTYTHNAAGDSPPSTAPAPAGPMIRINRIGRYGRFVGTRDRWSCCGHCRRGPKDCMIRVNTRWHRVTRNVRKPYSTRDSTQMRKTTRRGSDAKWPFVREGQLVHQSWSAPSPATRSCRATNSRWGAATTRSPDGGRPCSPSTRAPASAATRPAAA